MSNKIVYFNDSRAMLVFAYDFDLESGSISNKRILVDRRTTFGEPDGMVVEYVYTAMKRYINAKKSAALRGICGSQSSHLTVSWFLTLWENI